MRKPKKQSEIASVIDTSARLVRKLNDDLFDMRAALQPFADYADPRNKVRPEIPITPGSIMAKRQLTMGDCYAARDALARLKGRIPDER